MTLLLEKELLSLLFFGFTFSFSNNSLFYIFEKDSRKLQDLLVHDVYTSHLQVRIHFVSFLLADVYNIFM